MMAFATAIGATETSLRWDIPYSEEDRTFASAFRHEDRPLVVISPCSSDRSRNFRNWSIASYRSVIEELRTRNCHVLLTGGNGRIEQQYGEQLAEDGTTENLIGTTSLKQLFAIVDAADLLICPDSGPAHLATATGTPVIGLYATSNPGRTGPYLSQPLTVNRYPDAVRRYLAKDPAALRWGTRVRHAGAMDLITIDDVRNKLSLFFDT